jgi:class 3 adenylate cyclase
MNSNQKVSFFEELFLYSGQYALFYIIMNLVLSPIVYINNLGHVVLVGLLILQTYILSKYGSNLKIRFLGNFIVPLGYSLIESLEGVQFILNAAHIGFWLFAVITAVIQLFINSKYEKIADVFLVISNVLSFVYIYMYLDIKLSLVSPSPEQLEFYNFGSQIPAFFADIAHVYIFVASILLILIIAFGRQKILSLKDYIHNAFGMYVDPSVRDKILENNQPSKKLKTILFSDLRDFTSFSETHSPLEVTEMLNAHFSLWADISEKNNGVIDKYIGDAVLITFDSPQDAINCAIELIEKRKEVKNIMPLEIGIGIHSGEVIVGDIGSRKRKNYTVIGDNVNIASRLESLCKVKKTNILFSEEIKSQISNSSKYLGQVSLKGKKNKMKVYTL